MKCLHPVTLKRTDKQLNEAFLHGHPVSRYYLVPCGHCIECFKSRRLAWVFRMEKELLVSSSCYFITCTYDNENVPITEKGNLTLSVRDHQLFLKILRKKYSDCNIRYFMSGEYGDQYERPHYHYIIYNLPNNLLDSAVLVDAKKNVYLSPDLKELWKKGNVQIGKVNPGGMSYVAKYCQYLYDTSNLPDDVQKPFSCMSRNPGIGSNYQLPENWNKPYAYRDGTKIALPRFYRDKMDLPTNYEYPVLIEELKSNELRDAYTNEKRYFEKQKSKDIL